MPVFAQTPDGETPAKETVCDPLQEDGITKGLYGLCVAFCEAGDYADEADTITPEELAALETSTPSGRILANYNKKKDKANNPADPDMPCILVEEPCPCWTAGELASIDGFMNDDGYDTSMHYCGTNSIQNYIYEQDDRNIINYQYADTVILNGYNRCFYQYAEQRTDGYFYLQRFLSIEAGTLTEEQLLTCDAQITAAKAAYLGTKHCNN